MSKPFTKGEAREFAKKTKLSLRHLEQALQADDWEDAYQSIYSIGGNADYLVEKYEDWAYGDPS